MPEEGKRRVTLDGDGREVGVLEPVEFDEPLTLAAAGHGHVDTPRHELLCDRKASGCMPRAVTPVDDCKGCHLSIGLTFIDEGA